MAEAAAGVRAVVLVGADGNGADPAGSGLGVVAAVCPAARIVLVVVEHDDHDEWIESPS